MGNGRLGRNDLDIMDVFEPKTNENSDKTSSGPNTFTCRVCGKDFLKKVLLKVCVF